MKAQRKKEIKEYYKHGCLEKGTIPFAQMSYEEKKAYCKTLYDLLDDYPENNELKSFVFYAEICLMPIKEKLKYTFFSERVQITIGSIGLMLILLLSPFPSPYLSSNRNLTMHQNKGKRNYFSVKEFLNPPVQIGFF